MGVFASDFAGNIIYGNAWSQHQKLIDSLDDGDFLQKGNPTSNHDGIDDPLDSYALMLGHLNQGGTFTANSFSSNIGLSKKVTRSALAPVTNSIYYLFVKGTWLYNGKTTTTDW